MAVVASATPGRTVEVSDTITVTGAARLADADASE
jgi:hypothetical protein